MCCFVHAHTQAGSEPEPEDEGEAVEVFSEPTSILCVCTSLPTHTRNDGSNHDFVKMFCHPQIVSRWHGSCDSHSPKSSITYATRRSGCSSRTLSDRPR